MSNMATPKDAVLSILENIGLRDLIENFNKRKVTTLLTCKELSDTELSHLGLTTIGDRARFRAEVQASGNKQPATPTNQGSSTSTLRTFLLPSRSGNRFISTRKRLSRKTWTANVMCLSDIDQSCVPSHSEKICLQRSNLGLKKIVFDASGSESEVHQTLLKEFPKLTGNGGFELLYCNANKRQLQRLDVKWDVQHLKSVLGGQSRIYVRPIQNSLPLDENEENPTNTLEYPCQTCGKSFILDELRNHIADCKTSQSVNQASVEEFHPEETC